MIESAEGVNVNVLQSACFKLGQNAPYTDRFTTDHLEFFPGDSVSSVCGAMTVKNIVMTPTLSGTTVNSDGSISFDPADIPSDRVTVLTIDFDFDFADAPDFDEYEVYNTNSEKAMFLLGTIGWDTTVYDAAQ